MSGQKISFAVNKMRSGKAEGRLLEVLEKSPLENREKSCRSFGDCGGCSYQTMSYENQLEMKKNQVKRLIDQVCKDYNFEGILGSPQEFGYRNKMEFSFGDEFKNGPLAPGLHKKGSFHDIFTVDDCQIVDNDFAFSFFQTNSLGAEVLYSKVREYAGETKERNIFDLYSGTGTIAQLLAPVAAKVTGVEIV